MTNHASQTPAASGRARRRLIEPGDPEYVHVEADRPSTGGFLGTPPPEFAPQSPPVQRFEDPPVAPVAEAPAVDLTPVVETPAPAAVAPETPAPVVAPVAATTKQTRHQKRSSGKSPVLAIPPLPAQSVESAEAANAADSKHSDKSSKGEDASMKKGRKRLSEPALWAIEIAVWVVAAVILSSLLRLFVFQMFLVPSVSMENTLKINDRIAALKLAHYQRGDIIVFADPGNWLTEPATSVSPVRHFFETVGLLASTDQQYLVKRVIGLPGDHVQCCSSAGRIVVNGTELNESSYLKEPDRPASGIQFDIIVPAGRVFVMGDNRYDSGDSRYHLCQMTDQGLGMNAFVPVKNIVGPVRARVLPMSRTKHLPLPASVFEHVPAPSGSPPAVPSIAVTGGWSETCYSS